MLEGKAKIKETDMPMKMQNHAMASASQALDLYDAVDYTPLASHIKKVSDLYHVSSIHIEFSPIRTRILSYKFNSILPMSHIK